MRFTSNHLLGVAWAFLSLVFAARAQHAASPLESQKSSDENIMLPLKITGVSPGKAVKPGTELRILCVGDSITSGFSDVIRTKGNGYRPHLRNALSKDHVVFAGTEVAGNMTDGYYGAWTGATINSISDKLGLSLMQRPNIVLLHAGTNDLSDRISRPGEGFEPKGVAKRLGNLIDQVIEACPDAVILVAMIIVDFTTFPESEIQDCVHPSSSGYIELGHYWYDFITQIPTDWINDPVGADPIRDESTAPTDSNSDNDSASENGSGIPVVRTMTSPLLFLLLVLVPVIVSLLLYGIGTLRKFPAERKQQLA
ncbi:hypothetical protein G7Z17_g1993 [Cylindrodendrum hubeiense]|uniref:SGNH hydrolase-type esterase domain-containing protein n=1 Tax=Cylindrodendrum hubeiense TaxID=595255 RepID=A0A9P5LC21_9HYPO|nr:hypothetical protein G7Z17_g1993 [Cylindrodendrum hubeiense]